MCLGSKEPELRDLLSWSELSPLRNYLKWYDFAVDLLGVNTADNIKSRYFGGGDHACMQDMLRKWLSCNKSADCTWEHVIDALKKMDTENPPMKVIEAIEDECIIR